ncbi:MAG: riboflavin synthase [Bacteroidota bacterium]
MFTGIIESIAEVVEINPSQSNITFGFKCPFTNELKIDQSVAHNGVCLTVIEIKNDIYYVTAIEETLSKTNLGNLQVGSKVNIERCMVAGARLDGHIVQGHVDETATLIQVDEMNGSWVYYFQYDKNSPHYTVTKGSICVNGVSLTVVESLKGSFSVAIIPYTYEHTTFQYLKAGDKVNLEFDVLGKYVAQYMKNITEQ